MVIVLVANTTRSLVLETTFPSHVNQNFTVADRREVKRLNGGQWYQAMKSIENKTPRNVENTVYQQEVLELYFILFY